MFPRPARQLVNASTRQVRAFTLIELLLVLIILAVLAGIAVPIYTGQSKKAKAQATRASISNIESALQAFEIAIDRFPTTEEGLDALIHPPQASDGSQPAKFLKSDTVPTDGWGRPFLYRSPSNVDPANGYDLWSAGEDGRDDGGCLFPGERRVLPRRGIQPVAGTPGLAPGAGAGGPPHGGP